jgi:hypothetical protein
MAKNWIWMACVGAAITFQTAPALACKVVGYKNGEPLCETTSDASGYNRRTGVVGHYTNGQHFYPRFWRPGQSTTSNVRPASGQGCGSGWYLGSDGTCYPRM